MPSPARHRSASLLAHLAHLASQRPWRQGPVWRASALPGVALTLLLHALLVALASHPGPSQRKLPDAPLAEMTLLDIRPRPEAPRVKSPPPPVTLPPPPAPQPPPPALAIPTFMLAPEPALAAAPPRPPASMPAPPAPTAEEWAFASRYTLKNSKGYRYSWGQQVRSMMGTAVEGPDQGVVRFRIEIAPDGRLARLDTLWSTSAVAERLAREAIARMPPGPPTPTGQPLVFDRSIAFTPHDSSGPPLYRYDCQPDTPTFSNPFAWNGGAATAARGQPEAPAPADPQALADCLAQLPRDSIDAETGRDRRVMERWGWSSRPTAQPQPQPR